MPRPWVVREGPSGEGEGWMGGAVGALVLKLGWMRILL